MFCPSCGKSISDESKFCLHCGTRIPENSGDHPTAKISPLVAQANTGCPLCGQMDSVQKVEAVVSEGTAGQSITRLANHFILPAMPKGDAQKWVLWRIIRYKRSLLYYCHRDHVAYIPGQETVIEPAEVQSYYINNIEGKYCLIGIKLESRWMTGDWYFAAYVPNKNKAIVEVTKVKINDFWQLRKDMTNVKDVKAHAELVQQLEREGWLLVERGFEPPLTDGTVRNWNDQFGWLFIKV